ncbi:hypothetical protein EJ05DRAFT_534133 [Pseudovirgaria hyperparasitica]|uniref:Small ribosomal subunit protein bS6m n=1 Tax=Pseudovirgaria hyperparasitica TaxID=470096 RepID=A0A6A6WKB0_9PEZI|nr:uncharacterized protein EJ05DRAFT_534133 [Pseudovirgaria hyperparasitica]KAF2762611.1 hypothetical protein EJ05DRAFT_534133 [Pseudovirgaria hyperparasitica]
MVLYELIGLVRPGNVAEVKEIVHAAGSIILNANGVIRGITNWGVFLLPKPRHVLAAKHHTAHHFLMRFDSSADTQLTMRRLLSRDPRMMRHSCVKLGSKLSDIKDVPGAIEWSTAYKGNKNEEYEKRTEELQMLLRERTKARGLAAEKERFTAEREGPNGWAAGERPSFVDQ